MSYPDEQLFFKQPDGSYFDGRLRVWTHEFDDIMSELRAIGFASMGTLICLKNLHWIGFIQPKNYLTWKTDNNIVTSEPLKYKSIHVIHREDGPAIYNTQNLKDFHFILCGKEYNLDSWMKKLDMSDEMRIMLKLKYAGGI